VTRRQIEPLGPLPSTAGAVDPTAGVRLPILYLLRACPRAWWVGRASAKVGSSRPAEVAFQAARRGFALPWAVRWLAFRGTRRASGWGPPGFHGLLLPLHGNEGPHRRDRKGVTCVKIGVGTGGAPCATVGEAHTRRGLFPLPAGSWRGTATRPPLAECSGKGEAGPCRLGKFGNKGEGSALREAGQGGALGRSGQRVGPRGRPNWYEGRDLQVGPKRKGSKGDGPAKLFDLGPRG
jgi:hypothetical protein